MRTALLFTIGLVCVLVLTPVVRGNARADAPEAPLRNAMEVLKRAYATEIVLGHPLEIEGLKIIPLATVGMGFGQQQGSSKQGAILGAGGLLSPVGVLVISPKGIQLLPVPKGFFEQLLGVITPVLLHIIQGTEETPEGAVDAKRMRHIAPAFLTRLYGLLPAQGLKFGLFPWPLSLVLLFIAGWLALALLIAAFLPQHVISVAETLRENPLRTGMTGVLSYGVVLILAVVFAVSIIGLPFTFVLIGLMLALQLLGLVSVAWLMGQKTVAIMRRDQYAEGVYVLAGGVLLGLVRIIPIFGWIVWGILGLFGFGAVLLTHRRKVQREALGTSET